MVDSCSTTPPTIPKFLSFAPESSSIIRQYDLSNFVMEIPKFWVYDIIVMPETLIYEEIDMHSA